MASLNGMFSPVGAPATILGGLGSAVQGYYEGRQMREQMLDEQTDRREKEMGMSEKELGYLQGEMRSNQKLLKDPNMIQTWNKDMAPLGLHADPTTGIDPAMLNIQPYDPQRAATLDYMNRNGFSRSMSTIMTNSAISPQAKIPLIREQATIYNIDPSTVNQMLSASGFTKGLNAQWENFSRSIGAKVGLTQAQTDQIRALMPYRIGVMEATAARDNAQITHWNDQDSLGIQKLQQQTTKMLLDYSQNQQKIDNSSLTAPPFLR